MKQRIESFFSLLACLLQRKSVYVQESSKTKTLLGDAALKSTENLDLFILSGYRFVGQMGNRNCNQSGISGLTGYVGLKFELFK